MMPRLTITLSEETHRVLKEVAARQGRSISAIIEESLRFRGLKATTRAAELVARACARSGLTEDQALKLAVAETRSERSRR
jgi:predicted transcriptional regulator